MKKLMIMILAPGVLASCSKENDDLNSSSPNSQRVQQTKVFKANFYSSVDTDPNIPPTLCSGDIPGFANPGFFLHGHATHMGNIISQQSRGQDLTCDLNVTTKLLTTTVSGQIVAANGDAIFYTAIDTIDASNYIDQISTEGTIEGIWTITGGTGRFENATGSFNISGPVSFATGTFSYEGVGTITY